MNRKMRIHSIRAESTSSAGVLKWRWMVDGKPFAMIEFRRIGCDGSERSSDDTRIYFRRRRTTERTIERTPWETGGSAHSANSHIIATYFRRSVAYDGTDEPTIHPRAENALPVSTSGFIDTEYHRQIIIGAHFPPNHHQNAH